MSESIVVGLVVGVGVAAVGAYVGHCLRLREMRARWDEEERRKKSDRRRELLARELGTVIEFVDLVLESWSGLEWWVHLDKAVSPHARSEFGKKAYLIAPSANAAAMSLGDDVLDASLEALVDAWQECNDLIDGATRLPPDGKEEKYRELQLAMRQGSKNVRRRARTMLEEA
jgi:hypothetical protein